MDAKKRKRLMRDVAEDAKRQDYRGEAVLRREYADIWRELATNAEAARAPKYLTWTGRGE
jgi:hypothetical protein